MDGLPLLRVVLALLVVVGLLLALAWLARRSGYLASLKRSPRILTLETRRLGPRSQLCLITIDGTELLLGVTPQHISVLHQTGLPAQNATSHGQHAFTEHLQAARRSQGQP